VGAFVVVVTLRRRANTGSVGTVVVDGAQVAIGAGAKGERRGAFAALGYALHTHAGNVRRGAGWNGSWIDKAVSFHAVHLAVAQIRVVEEGAVGILNAVAGLNGCA